LLEPLHCCKRVLKKLPSPQGDSNSTNSATNANANLSYDNYAIFATQADFEQNMYNWLSLDSSEKVQYGDSLVAQGIMPLDRVLAEEDLTETWLGLDNISAILNKDNLIQIGDSLIKIDKVNNRAFILTPVSSDLINDLKNNEIVEGHIYLHETLEKPIFEEYEEDGVESGYGKRKGVLCRDGWARGRSERTYSWDNHWQVRIPANGTGGVRWDIWYATAGVWFSINSSAKMVLYTNGTIQYVVLGQREFFRHHAEISWRRRSGVSHSSVEGTVGYGSWREYRFPSVYTSPRALQRYSYKLWAQHSASPPSQTPVLFNAFSWPLIIEDH
jgi:hypothetical protein